MASRKSVDVQFLQHRLLKWYLTHKRELSWRRTRDPYAILVSEIMLQQTQVSRVQEKLPAFLREFPTVQKLARASGAEVIRAWQGMGYNKRAVHLRALAGMVVKRFDGRIPSEPSQLLKLPGIGKYTAHAIACFAFRRRVPVVDVNVRRVLSRYFWKMKSLSDVKPETVIWKIAAEVLHNNASEWNQALMDLGATICTGAKARCDYCPIQLRCVSRLLVRVNGTKTRSLSRTNSEPMYGSIPRRIWRGKIVETLRHVPAGQSLTLKQIGSNIKSNFNENELPWLAGVINGLIADGILGRSERNTIIKVRLATR